MLKYTKNSLFTSRSAPPATLLVTTMIKCSSFKRTVNISCHSHGKVEFKPFTPKIQNTLAPSYLEVARKFKLGSIYTEYGR